jgi:hypothetical protein
MIHRDGGRRDQHCHYRTEGEATFPVIRVNVQHEGRPREEKTRAT